MQRTVRVHLPLKQGLRPDLINQLYYWKYSTSASSIKTRIKTNSCDILNKILNVRVHLPLKQGLRLKNEAPNHHD